MLPHAPDSTLLPEEAEHLNWQALPTQTGDLLLFDSEHVHQAELERAARVACQALKTQLRDFTVTTEVGVGPGSGARHCWLLEFEGAIPDLVRCAELIDHDISQQNGDYSAHRASGAGLMPPRVTALCPGAFETLLRRLAVPSRHGRVGWPAPAHYR